MSRAGSQLISKVLELSPGHVSKLASISPVEIALELVAHKGFATAWQAHLHKTTQAQHKLLSNNCTVWHLCCIECKF